jgi:hypothetical protein
MGDLFKEKDGEEKDNLILKAQINSSKSFRSFYFS